ncbi:vacuolar H+ ATPase E1 [Coprinellus micaceus]|uniref:Vacuolar H+ ATPase E1 n=1 Tax=Coprinellus micaceus TaxID=71717 RepID=A0A4Y7ST67_COPMI|nr:vacuolar H+ ATPase E1 [Coprinellus micaceus]
MASRGLSEEEALTEMNKMVAFIKQEAQEKAREIKVKADEEFAIEKARLVKSEQQAIDAQYDKKRKGAEVAQKIAQSNLTNKARLRLLNRREEHLQDLFGTARNAISTLSQDKARYTKFLEDVILQGFLQILEPSARVIARPADVEVAKAAGEAAKEKYKEISGRVIEFEVVGQLSDDLAGGVKLISGTNRISVDNSLDERLRLLEDRMLPEIRKDSFGINENRKFYT